MYYSIFQQLMKSTFYDAYFADGELGQDTPDCKREITCMSLSAYSSGATAGQQSVSA